VLEAGGAGGGVGGKKILINGRSGWGVNDEACNIHCAIKPYTILAVIVAEPKTKQESISISYPISANPYYAS